MSEAFREMRERLRGFRDVNPEASEHIAIWFDALEFEMEREQKSQWQPIASAPKDGATIMLYCGERVYSAGIMDVYSGYWNEEDGLWGSDAPERDVFYQPSHWQRLPEGPK